MRFRVLVMALTVAAGALVPVAAAAPPTSSYDYTRIAGRSTVRYDDFEHEVFDVPMRDGVRIHIELYRPAAGGRFGTILKMSPYHDSPPLAEDRRGQYLVPEQHGSMVDYFVPRGYVFATADLRGSGLSQGCFDYLGQTDRKDVYEVVEWLARQPWSNGRVGMIGVSYPGSTPILAAAAQPPHLATIVPIAGWSQMYDHQFQNGVPYFLQWAGASIYEVFSVYRFARSPTGMGVAAPFCGAPTSSPLYEGEAYTSGARHPWHDAHDWSDASRSRVPVFLIHGDADFSIRINAIDWFNHRRRAGDKIWIGQWGHSAPPRDEQWVAALHAWFDKHLQGRRLPTGPTAEVFLNDESVLAAPRWPIPSKPTTLLTSSAGRLGAARDEPGVLRYVADASGHAQEHETGHVAFETEPLRTDTVLVGTPRLRLRVSVTSPKVHLIGTLYEVDGQLVNRIGQATFAIQPELRDGLDKPKVVVPGEVMMIETPGMTMAHVLRAGTRLRLVIASSHPDKVPIFGSGAVVEVIAGGDDGTSVTLPVIARPRLLPDVYQPEG
ncbi:MAG TPA: CocE/NonD family hydrolase [Mycobacteriales bacterium]|nr:CocE/NonD family hydrolase [Mycobacteriales bacterium]